MKTPSSTDADDNALRNLVHNGSDLGRPMLVDFQVAIPSREAATQFAGAAEKLGYRVTVYESPECTLPWTCQCSVRIVVSTSTLAAFQTELNALAARFDGHTDGWGSFGNKANES